MRTKRSPWSAVPALVVVAQMAVGQQSPLNVRLPTDTELHVAYCVPVLKSDIAGLQQFLQLLADPTQLLSAPTTEQLGAIRKALLDLKATLDRLQAYLLPRLPYLDPEPLVIATQRAEADLQRDTDNSRACVDKCKAEAPDKAGSCVYACMNAGDSAARLKACSNPTWLPF